MATLADVVQGQLADGNQSRQSSIIALNACMSVFATLAVGLRLYARQVVRVPWKADDYTIVFALLLSYGLLISTMEALHNGLGRHLFTNDFMTIDRFLKAYYCYLVLYPLCLPAVKISILLFYRRIFSTPRFVVLLHVIGSFVLLWSISGVLVAVFQCTPIAVFWDKTIDGGCIDIDNFVLAEGGITVATDVVILLMPLPLVWRLKISRQQKWAVSGVFMLGGLVCISSIARLPSLTQSITLDTTWSSYAPSQWSTAEVNLAIICACLPILRPLVGRRQQPAKRVHPSEEWQTASSGAVVSDVRAGRRRRGWWPSSIIRHNDFESEEHLQAFEDDPWGMSTHILMRQGILRTTTVEMVETYAPRRSSGASAELKDPELAVPDLNTLPDLPAMLTDDPDHEKVHEQP